MTRDEWQAEAIRRFGDDMMNWAFICPSCKTRITIDDYRKAKAPTGAIAFSCVGRWLYDRQEFLGEKKMKKGKVCNYSGGGLFNINPLKVDDELYFDFAPVKGEVCHRKDIAQ